ncbi:EF-hand domain-containing protein [Desulfovibrio aminophilus]|nr:EF-hand domain-containing protein [Desulfovibrio aminophilus]MCM0754013.1 EF-hand domain-containing protein [Desulfovibrio aminophilus]
MALSSICGGSEITNLFSLAQSAHMDKSDSDQAARLFKEKDTNGSGGLSIDEMRCSQEMFDRFDTNKDGVVSPAEFQEGLKQQRKEAAGQAAEGEMSRNAFLGRIQSGMGQDGEGPEAQMAADILGKYDTDGDGLLSAEESGLDAEKLASYDTDGDGLLSSSEIQAGLKADHEAMMAQGDNDLAQRIMGELDADGDGSLSTGELGSDTSISAFDTNGDGQVSAEELVAGLKSRREEMAAQMSAPTQNASSGQSTETASSDAASGSSSSSSTDDEMDTNHDGTVSTEEFIAWMEQHGNAQAGGSASLSGNLFMKALSAYREQADSAMYSLFGDTSGSGLAATA